MIHHLLKISLVNCTSPENLLQALVNSNMAADLSFKNTKYGKMEMYILKSSEYSCM